MTDDRSTQLLDALHTRFDDRWLIRMDGSSLRMEPRRPVQGEPKRSGDTTPGGVVHQMEHALAERGVRRDALLPIRWHRDTDLTISAIQALDPWLKDAEPRVWREGFLPQPVVRFTGERDADGRLLDGFLTAFVNLSCVMRIDSVERHVELLDAWISAFSATGLHAGRLALHGDLDVWTRDTVAGITIAIDADGVGLGDAVLLWNRGRPEYMASDLGSGLERLRWLLAGEDWGISTFGGLAKSWDWQVLDAIRAGTLLAMGGIRSASRGAGSALRRTLYILPTSTAEAGLGRLVRIQRMYWVSLGCEGVDWPVITTQLENEALRLKQHATRVSCSCYESARYTSHKER
jgi:hypothetical protein